MNKTPSGQPSFVALTPESSLRCGGGPPKLQSRYLLKSQVQILFLRKCQTAQGPNHTQSLSSCFVRGSKSNRSQNRRSLLSAAWGTHSSDSPSGHYELKSLLSCFAG